MAFMTLHHPDEVATNVLTIDASDPKSGTAEFKACAVRVERIVAAALSDASARSEASHANGASRRSGERERV
jgi:predicted molibdopterin-dependent oxidoreductase YjgC